ncbi:uncharacterized protein PHACADRAFT_206139 [Phanerochaete carnosa HHB-10118-sp]|uniref:Transmembrane protein n=1 Tax=Phanerochaete carnosa (strain HHB-10118-sp) TaxID=650164 RepID=K5WL76_PHACS|nr:uncharacterized protein PHACADRAFT_206139 [Phanerochaete carnosa HHB-10118-sp]EKM59919.1 hypothetical protein PHACADRAFT_206139 [Phanerochaete carnosa HHB-10118-sp]
MSQLPYNSTAYIVDDRDPNISYSQGWLQVTTSAEYNDTKTGADEAGMTAIYVFNGTGIEVYGSLGSYDVYGVPVSSYEIDGFPDTLVEYTAPLITPGTFAAHVLFYRSPPLQPAEHTLVITNINGTAPSVYWLDYILYTPSGGVNLAASSSSQISTSQSSTSASSPSASLLLASTSTSTSLAGAQTSSPSVASTSHTGAVVGGVVGGVVFLAALILSLFWFCYRKRNQSAPAFEGEVTAFGSWPANPTVRPSTIQSEKLASAAHTPMLSADTPSPSFPVASTSSLVDSATRTRQAAPVPPPTPQTNATREHTSSPSMRMHSDSGIRLPPGQVVDIPPAYTDD